MPECIFCGIAEGTVPADVVLATDDTVFFHDISPKTKVHVVGIPKQHIPSLDAVGENERALVGKLLSEVSSAAAKGGIEAEEGYRVITNIGPHAGQEIEHLHFHILGGEPVGPMVCQS